MSTHKLLGYFGKKFDIQNPGKTNFRYIIFASQRTGSNYLCSYLSNLKDAYGIPMEYLNADALETFGKRLPPNQSSSGKPDQWNLFDYIQRIEKVRTTADGWFGIKVQPWQLLPKVGNDLNGVVDFLNRFDRIIFMDRRDKLSQAVSGAIALKTRTWFNFSDEPNLGEADIASLFPTITRLIHQYNTDENLILSVMHHSSGKPYIHIFYEDIQNDPDATFQAVVEFLGGKNTASLPVEVIIPNTRKPSGVIAERVRKEFLNYLCGKPSGT